MRRRRCETKTGPAKIGGRKFASMLKSRDQADFDFFAILPSILPELTQVERRFRRYGRAGYLRTRNVPVRTMSSGSRDPAETLTRIASKAMQLPGAIIVLWPSQLIFMG